jgi:NADH-quinone oxidoreductase subunit J
MSELTFFYLFGGLILLSAFMVITVSNPVHSVLFLILVFVGAAALLLLLEVEFLSLMFIIIYVGAIAVLFLFVVMMLDIKLSNSSTEYIRYFSIGGFLGVLFFIETYYVIESTLFSSKVDAVMLSSSYQNWMTQLDNLTNMECLGQFLYTYYFFHFLIAGIVLLVGMIGAIVLTLNVNHTSKNQLICKQLSRQVKNATFLTTIS